MERRSEIDSTAATNHFSIIDEWGWIIRQKLIGQNLDQVKATFQTKILNFAFVKIRPTSIRFKWGT